MIIREVHVKSFRSILDESIHLDCLTALVGRNGAGKSSFLRALELFYSPSPKVTAEDFYAENTSQDMEIAVTFSELNSTERNFFDDYMHEDTLTVVRVFSLAHGRNSGKYYGMRLGNPDFAGVRSAPSKTDAREEYNKLKNMDTYSSLPTARSADLALDALEQWENEHPEECCRLRDAGQFFGFAEVGLGYLGRHTRFIRIPAVRDASDDATEGRGSSVTEIMDLVVRSVLTTHTDLTTFKEETQAKYEEILEPCNLKELAGLEDQLSDTLKQFAPDSAVSLRWVELDEIKIPMPQADVKLFEDGYESAVHRTGHGLQRAFILTMLQHLIAAREIENRRDEESNSEAGIAAPEELSLPSLVLAIEEPELYQHPSRQRHLASVLLQLSQGSVPGVAEQTQVIYSTHAPLFVGLDRFDQMRVLRKERLVPGNPKVTKVAKAEMAAVAEEIWEARGQQGERYTAETLRPRLQAVMTPWVNEGFFADIAVLVEGEGDRAALLGMAETMNYDFDSAGIAVVPCIGKNNLDRPLVIFRQLGIPVYVVWDSDHGDRNAKPDVNRYLLRLLGQAENDWPERVEESYACFKTKLETTLSDEIGNGLFDKALSEAQEQLGIQRRRDALKNPFLLRRVIEQTAEQGHTSSTLESIVKRIIDIRQKVMENEEI